MLDLHSKIHTTFLSKYVALEAEGLAQYRAKLQLLRSLAVKLNAKNVWPIYSSCLAKQPAE